MRKVKSNERSSTSTFWIFATWSLKIPSDSLERNATTCSRAIFRSSIELMCLNVSTAAAIAEGSWYDVTPFLNAAWKSLTAASLSVGCAAPADLIGLRVEAREKNLEDGLEDMSLRR
jgi:hypothetical protein